LLQRESKEGYYARIKVGGKLIRKRLHQMFGLKQYSFAGFDETAKAE